MYVSIYWKMKEEKQQHKSMLCWDEIKVHDYTHVVPDDNDNHVMDHTCWCEPGIQFLPEGWRIIHRALN